MTKTQIEGRLAAANVDDRVLSYRLLPFGEPGRTNLGLITFARGTVQLPDNPGDVVLNMQHDRNRPVGRAIKLEEREDGIYADFRIADTSAGDDLLVEAADGLRTGVSVETEPTVVRAGRAVHAVLDAAGAVVTPAFPSAQLLVAADCGDLPPNTTGGTMPTTAPAATEVAPAAPAATETAPAGEVTPTEEEQQLEQQQPAQQSAALTAAQAPAGMQSPRMHATDRVHDGRSASQMLAQIAQESGGGNRMTSRLIAALDELTTADMLDVAVPESFEGKVWQGSEYERRFSTMFDAEPLTKLKYRGWRWEDNGAGGHKKPAMAPYAGFPAEPPTNEVKAEETTWEPNLIAWAGQMDRRYRDFSDPDYWAAFFTAVATSYAKVTDMTEILTAAWNGATPLELDVANKPAGVPEGLWKLIKGVRMVLPYGMPTSATMHADLWEEVLWTTDNNALRYLELSLGMQEGQLNGFNLHADEEVLAAGEVLVAVRRAAKFRELPGAPIRIDAEVISKGGIEQGVFGYAGLEVFEPLAIAAVQDVA